MNELLDLIAAWLAEQDQAEAELGRRLGLDHGIPLDFKLLVSPDVGLKLLTALGHADARLIVTWYLPPQSVYVMARDALRRW